MLEVYINTVKKDMIDNRKKQRPSTAVKMRSKISDYYQNRE